MMLIIGNLTGRVEGCDMDESGRWINLRLRWKKGRMITVTVACNPNFNAEMVGDSHASRLNKFENSALSMH